MNAGEILVRQKGLLVRPGTNTYLGKDWTIHTRVSGTVHFRTSKVLKFNGKRTIETIVSVAPVTTK